MSIFPSKSSASDRRASGRDASRDLPGTVESDFLPNAKKRYFSIFILPMIRSVKDRTVTVLMGAINIGLIALLWHLMPLKERVPFIVDYNPTTNTFEQAANVEKLTADTVPQRTVEFQAQKWVRWLLVVDSQTTDNLSRAGTWTRGDAVNELTEWIAKDHTGDRRVTNPNYTRTIEQKIGITYGQNNKTMFLHVQLVERDHGTVTGRSNKVIQLDYDEVLGTSKDDSFTQNPIDMAISNFSIGDE